MQVKYYLKTVDGLIVPQRANPTDAGYDVTATSEPKIVGIKTDLQSADNQARFGEYFDNQYVEYETNLYFVPDKYSVTDTEGNFLDFHTDLRPRSSVSKYNLVLANSIGLIDRGYHNQVLVRFKYIWQPADLRCSLDGNITGTIATSRLYKKGDKICQVLPMLTHDISFTLVDALPGDDRGGGFGSTDKPK